MTEQQKDGLAKAVATIVLACVACMIFAVTIGLAVRVFRFCAGW